MALAHGYDKVFLKKEPVDVSRRQRPDRQHSQIELVRVELGQRVLPHLSRRAAVSLRHQLQYAYVYSWRISGQLRKERPEEDGSKGIGCANGERPLRRLRLERPRSRHDPLKTRQKVGNRSGKHERALRRLHADRHLEEQRILKKLP